MLYLILASAALSSLASRAVAQDATVPSVVSVGKGSYASFPPALADQSVRQMASETIPLVDPPTGPIPTNKWWSDLLVHPIAGQLWAFPFMVRPDDSGLNVFYPVKWNDRGTDPVSDSPLSLRGENFHPVQTLAKNWGDWTVTFREKESADRYWDVTLGRGLPYVWIELHNVAPWFAVPADATLFGDGGQSVNLPVTSDHIGIRIAGRSYGLYTPDGSRFVFANGGLGVEFDGAQTYLVICPLTHDSDLATFHQFAYAIPRDTRMTWNYDAAAGNVTTDWRLTTQQLKGTEPRLIQGWLPHHYREGKPAFDFDSLTYLTPRGTMRCSVGDEFRITFPFAGFPPMLPPPHATGLPHDFDEARMRDYLARYATKTTYGDDTYWGGKALVLNAQYMIAAQQMHDPSFDALHNNLRTALTDWYTYTPGENAHYFVRYPNWRALIGLKPSYGSEAFNDNHFHYGYFTMATALLCMVDPQFLRDYGPMAKLVAKEYASWDRSDPDFPFLRCFDIWEGHSWASGLCSPTGANQESSSEAMQSWGGLFLLGTVLGDKDMASAGAMGYAIESAAVREYWFDEHGDNFAPSFGHTITGMVWGGGNLYGTYFSGDPAWIYGIQWLPMAPMMDYLVTDPDYARSSFRAMLAEETVKKGTATISSMGPELGSIVLGEAGQVNPDWATDQLDQLWAAGDPVAHDNGASGMTYYFAHANRHLGPRLWDTTLSVGTGAAYYNSTTNTTSYVVYNPLPISEQVIVTRSGKRIGALTVPPNTLVCKTALGP